MKLVLYNPPSSASRKPILPMSLLALGALLEGRHDYVVIDGNLEEDPLAALDRAVREGGATLLAVTVMPGPQLENALPVCRRLKGLHPELPIVWGGYFPTQHWETCLRDACVDYVVRGHGEVAFRDLVDALERGDDPRRIAGVAARDDAGEPASPGLPALPHPQELPDFPYHRVDVGRYARRTFMGTRTLPHHSSYGCPFLCNFCAVVNMVDGAWLAQSAERAAAVAERLVREHGADALELYDNNFFVKESRTVEFAERIEPLGIGWWGEARIDTLLKYREASWRRMRAAGLRMVFLGAESGSDETLRRMNKGGTASAGKTLEIVARMAEHDIVPELSFVLGNPPDPEADVRSTLDLIRRVKRINPRAEIILYLYTPVPLAGTLYEEARAAGFRFPETLDEWTRPDWHEVVQRRSAHLPWVPPRLRRRLADFERVLNAYYPTSTDPGLGPATRRLLRTVSAWRYHLRLYRFPFELAALHRLVAYQRPETSGF